MAPDRPLTAGEARRLGPVRRFFAEHPSASDVLVCLFAAVPLLMFTVPEVVREWSGTPRQWVGLAGIVVVVGVLAVRRAHPMSALAVVAAGTVALAAGGWGLAGGGLAYGLAMYALAAARPARSAWPALGIAFGVLLAGGLAWPTAEPAGPGTVSIELRPYGVAGAGTGGSASSGVLDVAIVGPLSVSDLLGLSWLLLAGVGGLAVGASVRNRREHVAALVQRSADLVLAAEQRARLASAEERTVIAREVHDVVAHSLSVMIALADGARAIVDRDPALAGEALDGLTERGRAALGDMRRVVGGLRDEHPPLSPQPTDGDLDVLVAGFREAGLPVRLTRVGPDVPGTLGLAVYRIVQESLTNVLRHVPGVGSVDVDVRVDAEAVVLTVCDDGGIRAAEGCAPVEPAAGDRAGSVAVGVVGRGIVGMRERVALHDGTLHVGPHHGGWRVRASLRLPGRAP